MADKPPKHRPRRSRRSLYDFPSPTVFWLPLLEAQSMFLECVLTMGMPDDDAEDDSGPSVGTGSARMIHEDGEDDGDELRGHVAQLVKGLMPTWIELLQATRAYTRGLSKMQAELIHAYLETIDELKKDLDSPDA